MAGIILEKLTNFEPESKKGDVGETDGPMAAMIEPLMNAEATMNLGPGAKVISKELTGETLFDPKIGQPCEMTMIVDLKIGLPEGVSGKDADEN